MATSDDGKGNYEFVDSEETIPQEFKCHVCLGVACCAVETTCCGFLLCRACSDKLKQLEQSCPHCRKPLQMQSSYFARHQIRQLHVYCTNRNCCSEIESITFPINPDANSDNKVITYGLNLCMWSGEINDLQHHLDKYCPHTTVTCRYNCGVQIVRCQKDVHEAEVCCKRPFTCWFCNIEDTAEVINDHNATGCDFQPIKCPNGCSAAMIQRRELQFHLEQQCPLQEISCDKLGCTERILRKDYDTHNENNTQKHIQLINDTYKSHIRNYDALIQENQMILANEQTLCEEYRKTCSILESRAQFFKALHLQNISIRVNITIGSVSDSFFIFGYHMMVKYEAVGYFSLHILQGQYDDTLPWPLQGTVTLELMNETLTFHINTMRPTCTQPIALVYAVCITAPSPLYNITDYRLSLKDININP